MYIVNITNADVDCLKSLDDIFFNIPTRSMRHYRHVLLAETNHRQNSLLCRAANFLYSVLRDHGLDVDIFNCNVNSLKRKIADILFEARIDSFQHGIHVDQEQNQQLILKHWSSMIMIINNLLSTNIILYMDL